MAQFIRRYMVLLAALAICTFLILAMTQTMSTTAAPPLGSDAKPLAAPGAFGIIDHVPVTHAAGVAIDANIAATFTANVDIATVNSDTWVAHGDLSGLITGTYSGSGPTVQLDPFREFHAGERVSVVATNGISSTGAMSATATQFSFTAGPVISRCMDTFVDIQADLIAVDQGAVDWGDYDYDGDLDILLTGRDGNGDETTKIYRNDVITGGGFLDIGAAVADVMYSSVDWGDYDNDGDLDILLSGSDASLNEVTRVLRNDVDSNSGFTDIGASLPALRGSSVEWGDYDNDGDLDILIAGSGTGYKSFVYRNMNGSFVEDSTVSSVLPGVYQGSVAWGDYDNDGDLDVLITGYDGSNRIGELYRNEISAGGGFVKDATASAAITPVTTSSVAWADYNGDGRLDILLSGSSDSGEVTNVYRNNGPFTGSDRSFENINAGLTAAYVGSASWGDYDNDGDPDILSTGVNFGAGNITRIYRNDVTVDGTFREDIGAGAGLVGVKWSSAAWGDYDGDGDLDILLTGNDGASPITKIYRNDDCFQLIDSSPSAHAIGVETNSNITSTFDADILDYSVNSLSWIAHGDYSGLLSGTVSVAGPKIFFDPVRPLYAGEDVRVVATDRISSTYNYRAKPTQLSFIAGNVHPRCVGGFTDINAGLAGLENVSTAWGDYDNDGDLDILASGLDNSYIHKTQIYRNDVNRGGGFAVDATASASLPDTSLGDIAWGDYDGDADLDILISGATNVSKLTEVYRNDVSANGTFFATSAGLTDVSQSSLAWGDYDNDGDLDILLTGYTGTGRVAAVYRNDVDQAGGFTAINAGLSTVMNSSVAWGDYDNDGDLDILLTGWAGGIGLAIVYRNDGPKHDGWDFVDIGAGLTPMNLSAAAWGDFDNDSDLDILLTGWSDIDYETIVYRNDVSSGGGFVNLSAPLVDVAYASVDWGDYDNDGDLDILLAGDTGASYVFKVYRNDFSDGGAFTEDSSATSGMAGLTNASVRWGDYDNDGDLDILYTGDLGADNRVTRIYRNDDCADLVITKQASVSSLRAGKPLSYKITLENSGEQDIVGANIADNLPIGFILADVTTTASAGLLITQTSPAPSLAWELSPMPPGASGVITLNGAVDAALQGVNTLVNQVNATTVTTETSKSNNSASVSVTVIEPVALNVSTVGKGTVTRQPKRAVYDYGTVVTLSATPDTGWVFTGWSGDIGGATNPRVVTLKGSKNVVATFAKIPAEQHTLTTNVIGNGSVTRQPDRPAYDIGVVVKLTTVADTGWQFTGWSGDASGSNNPRNLTMNRDKTVTATFVKQDSSTDTGSLRGIVVEDAGKPVPGVLVTLTGPNNQASTAATRSDTTNAQGSYDFSNVPVGSYTLTFSKQGYETPSSVTVKVSKNKTRNVDPVTMQDDEFSVTGPLFLPSMQSSSSE